MTDDGPLTEEDVPELSKLGRPTKLTEEITAEVCKAIRAGAYVETAAAFAGIAKDTLYAWMKRGARDHEGVDEGGIYRDFSDALSKALADAEMADLLTIRAASQNGAWQASAWRLERRFPQRWRQRQGVDVKPILDDAADREEVELAQLEEEMRAAYEASLPQGVQIVEATAEEEEA